MPKKHKKDTELEVKSSGESHEDIPSFLKGDISSDTEVKDDVPEANKEDKTEVYETQVIETKESKEPKENDNVYDDMLEEAKSPGFLGKFDELLVELNLDRKHFMMLFSFFALILVGIIIGFMYIFSVFGNEPKAVNIDKEPEKVQVVEKNVKNDENGGFFSRLFRDKDKEISVGADEVSEDVLEDESENDNVVTRAVDAGKTINLGFESKALAITISLGEIELVDDKLSFYVRSYRKLRNLFNTDLFSYLDGLENREEGYNNYLIQIKAAYEQSRLAHNDLLSELSAYNTRLSQLDVDSGQIEDEFFRALDNLESEKLPELLNAFQSLVSRRDIVRSELKAREAIAIKFEKSLPVVESKIKAIELNKDAFVKGVKVVEFEQVDLDLIIEGVE